jgi:hypothetical protein
MTVKFRDVRSAEACMAKMNGRFFDGRKVCCLSSSHTTLYGIKRMGSSS